MDYRRATGEFPTSDVALATPHYDALTNPQHRHMVEFRALHALRTTPSHGLTRATRRALHSCTHLSDLQRIRPEDAAAVREKIPPLLEEYTSHLDYDYHGMVQSYQQVVGGNWRF